jgi:ELWxxDGT repeat protein
MARVVSMVAVLIMTPMLAWGQVEMVADLRLGPEDSRPTDLVVLKDQLLFWANGDGVGSALFSTDGATVRLLADMNPGTAGDQPWPDSPLVGILDGELFFRFRKPPFTESVSRIWSTDGETANLVSEVHAQGGSVGELGDVLVFEGLSDTTGLEPWVIDPPEVRLLKDLFPGAEPSLPDCFKLVGTSLLFSARVVLGEPRRLLRTDGTTVDEVASTPIRCFRDRHAIVYRGELFFGGDDQSGVEPWRSDGLTSAPLGDINPGPESSLSLNWIEAMGKLFFVANDGVHGYEWWSWDGANVALELDLNPGAGSGLAHIARGHPTSAIEFNGMLYFAGDDGSGSTVLWSWDGADLNQVTPECEMCGDNHPYSFFVNGQELLFGNYDPDHGNELWVLRDDQASMIVDLYPGPASSYPTGFTAYNGDVYFSARSPVQIGLYCWLERPITERCLADS